MCGEYACTPTHTSTMDPGYLCCEHSMGLNVLSSQCVLSLIEDLAREAQRKRTVISPSQTRILVQAFKRDHFPGIATRAELAHQMGIPAPQIQVSSPASTWAQDMAQEAQHPQQSPILAQEARRKRTIISPRTKIFVQAFMRVHFPAIAAREELAHQTGIPEPRIQIWFQNRRARHPQQSPSGPRNGWVQRLGGTLAMTTPAPED
uniref:Homeobox domain-containing protein n=1 Tax=Bos indicus x Bos taurus TaxID=30522 RepID=A0A4W2IMA7_BOBOX